MREAGSLRRSADAADRRAANDAIVRLTRLGSPELERIADSGDGVDEVQAAEHHFDQQSSIAMDDALATLLRSEERLLSSQGSNGPRRGSPIHARTSTMMRPLSGVSRPRSPADSERATPDTPLRGTSPDLDSGRGEGGRTSPGMDLLTAGSSRSYVGGGGGGGSVATHTGSAATLPSKARALLDRHSFYSSGVRNYDNLPPRNFTIHGEPREKPVRVRRTLESREASGYVDLHPERRQDGSSRGARILCVKQIIQKAVAKQGSYSRAQLERSFRRADKDSSGALEFSELCASLREDFKIAGLTTADILRVFRTMDADQSGSVSCREFVEAIDSTPPPVLRNPVGYRRVPSSLELKKREAFTLWPTSFSLGTFRSRLESRNVEIVVQNVGLVELRLRAHVLGLVAASPRDGGLGQAARIVDKPRGTLAPGLRGRVVVEFSAAAPGSITALIVIEGGAQQVEVPVDGVSSDGHEHFDAVHSRITTTITGAHTRNASPPSSVLTPSHQKTASFMITQTVGPQSEGGWFGEEIAPAT